MRESDYESFPDNLRYDVFEAEKYLNANGKSELRDELTYYRSKAYDIKETLNVTIVGIDTIKRNIGKYISKEHLMENTTTEQRIKLATPPKFKDYVEDAKSLLEDYYYTDDEGTLTPAQEGYRDYQFARVKSLSYFINLPEKEQKLVPPPDEDEFTFHEAKYGVSLND